MYIENIQGIKMVYHMWMEIGDIKSRKSLQPLPLPIKFQKQKLILSTKNIGKDLFPCPIPVTQRFNNLILLYILVHRSRANRGFNFK